MTLTHERVEPKILAKIKIYDLTRTELLFTLCHEIPCICLALIILDSTIVKFHALLLTFRAVIIVYTCIYGPLQMLGIKLW